MPGRSEPIHARPGHTTSRTNLPRIVWAFLTITSVDPPRLAVRYLTYLSRPRSLLALSRPTRSDSPALPIRTLTLLANTVLPRHSTPASPTSPGLSGPRNVTPYLPCM